MDKLNLKCTSLRYKWILFIAIAVPLIAGGAINQFGDVFVDTLRSNNASPSQSGTVRLGRTDTIKWRNEADSADLSLGVNSSNQLNFDGQVIPSPTSGTFDDSGFYVYDDGDATKKLSFQLSGITTGTTRTITVPDSNVNLGALTNSNISASAGIDLSKLAALTPSMALQSDSLGEIVDSVVTSLELSRLSGISSNVQTQIDGKVSAASPTFTGTVTTPLTTAGPVLTSSGGVLSSEAQLAVGRGGTGLASGTSGGILGFTASGTIASSAALSANQLVIGGGAGATPSTLTAGSQYQVLTMGASNPGYGAVSLGQAAAVTGTLPIANGGTNNGSLAVTAGGVVYTDGSKLVNVGAGTSGQVLKSNGSSAPTWGNATGGAGGINYASELFDGTSVTGINRYADSGATPTDCTGGSPSITAAALNTSTPLRSTSSQRLSKDGSNRQGEGWSWDFTIPSADREGGKSVFVQYRVKTSAAYENNDVRMFVYDKDGTTLLNVTSLSASDGSVGTATDTKLYTGLFYPDPDNDDYRLCWHIAGTTASAWDLDLIDLKVGPDSPVPGAIVSEWKSFSPTGSWTTNTTYSGFKRRVGDTEEVQVYITLSGAPGGSADLTIDAPSSVDYNKLTGGQAYDSAYLGSGYTLDSGSAYQLAYVQATTSANVFRVTYQVASTTNTTTSPVTSTAPFTYGSGDTVILSFRYPVSNWSASAALSTTEAMLNGSNVMATKTSGSHSSTGNWEDVSWTETKDLLGSFDGTTFTAPKKMTVRVHGVVGFAANASGVRLARIVNGSGTLLGMSGSALGSASVEAGLPFSATLDLNKNDTVKIQAYQDSGGSLNYFATNAIGSLAIEEVFTPSIFSTYGQFELLTATSTAKTPSATDQWHAQSGNSLTLPPGTWRLTGMILFTNNGSTPTYTAVAGGWASANGADSSSTPAWVTGASGLTLLSAINSGLNLFQLVSSGTGAHAPVPSIVVRTTAPSTVLYLNSYSSQSTSANARVTVYANAERLQ